MIRQVAGASVLDLELYHQLSTPAREHRANTHRHRVRAFPSERTGLDNQGSPAVGLERGRHGLCQQMPIPETGELEMTIYKHLRLTVAVLFVFGTGFGVASQAAADAMSDIKAAGQINVGIFSDFPPFSSASADMSIKGYDVDVAQFIADSLAVKLNLVSVTGQNRIPYLTDKRVDLLMSVGYSKERAEVIDYAAAYAPYYIAVIGPAALEVKGKDDLADKSIAVNRGTLEDTSLTEAAPSSADIRRFDNYNAVIQAFISGQTQLMVVGNDVGAQVLARQEELKPEQKFQLLTSPSHIGLNKNEEALKTAVNDAVAKMLADGKLNESSEAWLKVPLNPENLKD
jgi:polar amino acid transport system substrate-binding protein